MSSGDLLFIFSFIVLPTIILVSCIWALWLIRAGVLLPPRRVSTDAFIEADQRDDTEQQPQAISAARVIVGADVAATITAATPDTPSTQLTVDAPIAEMPFSDDAEITTAQPVGDMTADLPRLLQSDSESVAPVEQPLIADSQAQLAPAEESYAVDDAAPADEVVASLPQADDLDILLVPLDSPEPPEKTRPLDVEPETAIRRNGKRKPNVGPGQRTPATRDGSRRKPNRRPAAQLRPTEDPEPRGNALVKRSRGNRQ